MIRNRNQNIMNILNTSLGLNFYSLFNFLSCRNIDACWPPCAVLFIHSAKGFSTIVILHTKLDDSCKKNRPSVTIDLPLKVSPDVFYPSTVASKSTI